MAHIKQIHSNNHLIIAKDGISTPLDNIIYIESNLHNVIYHVYDDNQNETEYVERCKLQDVENLLCDKPFCRIHQSYLVNMNYIDRIKRYFVILTTGKHINVSKRRYSNAKDKILKFKGIV